MKTESVLEKVFASGELAVTSECGPPRGAVPEKIIEKAKMLQGYVDAVVGFGYPEIMALHLHGNGFNQIGVIVYN